MSKFAIGSDGVLKVDGYPLPCMVRSVSCRGKIIMDASNVEGSSGKKKVFDGFDDWDISIEAAIYEPAEREASRYDHLLTINKAFKKLDDGLPTIYSISGNLASALNIRQVLFAGMEVTDTDDALNLSINFTEHNPVVAIVQEQQNRAADASEDKIKNSEESSSVSDSAYHDSDVAALKRAASLYE